jgi:hypothetical protein
MIQVSYAPIYNKGRVTHTVPITYAPIYNKGRVTHTVPITYMYGALQNKNPRRYLKIAWLRICIITLIGIQTQIRPDPAFHFNADPDPAFLR